MTIDGKVVERAYQTVEAMLREAVETAKRPEDFKTNLGYCQLVGTRLLAVLIYNAHVQTKADLEKSTDLVVTGIRRELEDIQKAAAQEKLDSVEVNFNA